MDDFNKPIGSDLAVLGRIIGVDQVLFTKADVASITRRIVNCTTGTVISTTSLVVADVVFDTPQTDYGWEDINGGYNFRDGLNLSSAGIIQLVYTFSDQASRETIFVVKGQIVATP